MSNDKLEKPLEHYTVDNFLDESRKLIGQPVSGPYDTRTYESAYFEYTSSFALTLGDTNPLYTEFAYALMSRYHMPLAPPTFLITFRYPVSQGALFDGPYPLAGFEAGFDWEWHDVVRMNDRFTTEHLLTEVYERPTAMGRTVFLVSECKYWNQLKELVATCRGTYAAIARAESITEIPEAMSDGFRKHLITDRKPYHYSEEEVDRLVNEVKAEVARGPKSLYWEDVHVGDQLPTVVKGPLTLADLMHYTLIVYSTKVLPGFEMRYRRRIQTPGYMRTNLLIGWPYDIHIASHMDPNMSGAAGMPDLYAMGTLRTGFCTHLLANWMGDDGFLKKLNVEVLEPYIYGDTMWISGEVVEKYKEKLNSVLYGAVDVKLEAVNQLGEQVQPGTATVYLPSPGHEVGLPIPQ